MIPVNRVQKWFKMTKARPAKKFDALAQRLTELSVTQLDIAGIADIDKSQISRWVNGRLPAGLSKKVRQFCKKIGIEPGPFVQGKIVVDPTFDPKTLQTPESKLKALIANPKYRSMITQIIDTTYAQASQDDG